MIADYRGIHSEAVYYVPEGCTYEVWKLTVKNNSRDTRDLTLTGYAEFTNHGNYEQDLVNLQYSMFISRTVFEKNRILQQLHGNLSGLPEEKRSRNDQMTERFFGMAGEPVASWCGD